MSKKMVGIIGAAALTSALFVGVPAGAFASEPAGSGIESCSGQWSCILSNQGGRFQHLI